MDKPGRRSRIPRVRFSVSSGNMVRKANIKGMLSGFRNISAKSMKDMTGIERMMARQLPEQVFFEHCAVVIDNNGTPEEAIRQVTEILDGTV